MSLKFAEVVLAVKFRVERADGTVSGGPMWYLSRGLTLRGMPRLGRFLAYTYAIFALVALVAFIQILQVNQSYSQVRSVLNLGENLTVALVYGIIFTVLVGREISVCLNYAIHSVSSDDCGGAFMMQSTYFALLAKFRESGIPLERICIEILVSLLKFSDNRRRDGENR